MTNSELASLELQARIMGWEPAVTEDAVIEVPGPVQDDMTAARWFAYLEQGLTIDIAFRRLKRRLDRSEY